MDGTIQLWPRFLAGFNVEVSIHRSVNGCNGRCCWCHISLHIETNLCGIIISVLNLSVVFFVLLLIVEDEGREMPHGRAFPYQLRRGKPPRLQRFYQVRNFVNIPIDIRNACVKLKRFYILGQKFFSLRYLLFC